MLIKEKKANGVPVLALTGKLDIFAKNAFREALEKHQTQGSKILLDFKGISFIDSVGIGTLVVAAQAFKKLKGSLILVNPTELVQEILTKMDLPNILTILTANEDYSSFSKIS
ncbi:MAG: STAS domain-containing protein [Nitrospirae bacterium]|nr:STAS domain-containing protein [Nitrospirota bacterium]